MTFSSEGRQQYCLVVGHCQVKTHCIYETEGHGTFAIVGCLAHLRTVSCNPCSCERLGANARYNLTTGGAAMPNRLFLHGSEKASNIVLYFLALVPKCVGKFGKPVPLLASSPKYNEVLGQVDDQQKNTPRNQGKPRATTTWIMHSLLRRIASTAKECSRMVLCTHRGSRRRICQRHVFQTERPCFSHMCDKGLEF